jgi:hypothetical protein
MLGLAVLAVLVLVARFVVSLDAIVAREIQRIGSEITGVAVKVGAVELALRDGRGTIRGLRVGNPEGFSEGEAFRLGEITVEIDVSSLRQAPVVLPQIRIVAPEVNVEFARTGKSNLEVLLEHVQGPAADQADAPESSGQEEPLRLAVRHFVIESGALRGDVSAVSGAGADRFEADLPPVRLSEVGGRAGATPVELGETVLQAFLRQALRSVAARQASKGVERGLGGGELGKEAGRIIERILN